MRVPLCFILTARWTRIPLLVTQTPGAATRTRGTLFESAVWAIRLAHPDPSRPIALLRATADPMEQEPCGPLVRPGLGVDGAADDRF